MDVTSGSDSPGLPAIQPHLPGVPAFTEDDVRQYIEMHGFSALRVWSVGTLTITCILFTTSREASDLMNCEIGLPDDALVCLVELSGDFLFTGGPYVPGMKREQQPTIVHHAHEAIDARTGHILVRGAYR